MKPIAQSKKQIKSYLVKALLVCLGIAGLLGIWGLLAGEMGATQGRILISTVILSVFSVFALIYLAISDKPYRWLGAPGIVASAAMLLIGLFIIWNDFVSWQNWEIYVELIKYFFVSLIVAGTCAQAGILLAVTENANSTVRIVRAVTLVAMSGAGAILIALILNRPDVTPELVMRLLGVLAIIDAVGSIATPALARLGGHKKA